MDNVRKSPTTHKTSGWTRWIKHTQNSKSGGRGGTIIKDIVQRQRSRIKKYGSHPHAAASICESGISGQSDEFTTPSVGACSHQNNSQTFFMLMLTPSCITLRWSEGSTAFPCFVIHKTKKRVVVVFLAENWPKRPDGTFPKCMGFISHVHLEKSL